MGTVFMVVNLKYNSKKPDLEAEKRGINAAIEENKTHSPILFLKFYGGPCNGEVRYQSII